MRKPVMLCNTGAFQKSLLTQRPAGWGGALHRGGCDGNRTLLTDGEVPNNGRARAGNSAATVFTSPTCAASTAIRKLVAAA